MKYHEMRWLQKVRQSLSRIEGALDPNAVMLSQNTSHHFRLLNLRVWCLRYHVSLDFILKFLLHRQYKNIRRSSYQKDTKVIQLGVSIPTLCGKASRHALEREILHRFPANENDHIYKSQLFQKAADLKSHCLIKPTDNLQEDTKRYISTMKARNQRLNNTSKLKRRPWRDNPWR